MKNDKFKNLAKSTMMVSALSLGANMLANDITPGSWNALAMGGKSSEEKAEHKCGEGECGAKKMEKKGEHQCGEGGCGEDHKDKATKKGADGSCGEETCGA